MAHIFRNKLSNIRRSIYDLFVIICLFVRLYVAARVLLGPGKVKSTLTLSQALKVKFFEHKHLKLAA